MNYIWKLVFNMIKIDEAKNWWNIFNSIVNASLVVQHVIQIKNGIMVHVNVSVKIIAREIRIMAEILPDVFVRMVSI